MSADPYDLNRFVEAQGPVYAEVCDELRDGRKRTHWMWFVFPQLRGLGTSSMADRYGIASLDEARAYWAHPALGPRLRECVELVLAVPGRSAREIFGQPDDWKLHSCLTLFASAAPEEPVFANALDRFFEGRRSTRTSEMLGDQAGD